MIGKKVYSEVYALLLALGNDYINRIPKDIFEFIASQRDKAYEPLIDENIEYQDQPICLESFAMLAWLRLHYWCSSEEEKARFMKHLGISEEDLTISTRELMHLLKDD